jgi:hypothetical protein
LWLSFLLEEILEVDFCGEGDRVIQLDLSECLQIED